MSAGDVLLVVASVVAALGGSATIDRGRLAGLQAGDRGLVTYEISVAGEAKRIEAGEATVVAVELDSAELAAPAGSRLGTRHRVEFRLPAERLGWDQILAATPEAERRETLDRLMSRQLASEPEIRDRLAAALAAEPGPLLEIPGGSYRIGLPTDQAVRYDQQPAFDHRLAGFAIDRRISPRTAGLAQPAASAFCAGRGGRLPTEFEWEVASATPGFDLESGYYEWTSSTYRPYPGNDFHESAYDGRHLVIRGDLEPDALTPHRRRFLQPAVAHEKVAARCAWDLD